MHKVIPEEAYGPIPMTPTKQFGQNSIAPEMLEPSGEVNSALLF